jgi:hypothetical protein
MAMAQGGGPCQYPLQNYGHIQNGACYAAPNQQYGAQYSDQAAYGGFDQQTGPVYEAEPMQVKLQVPEGAGPGYKLQYVAPDGQELRLTVPEGVPPGSIMTLTQDPATKQWKCMAEPADQPPSPAPAAYEPPQALAYEAPPLQAYAQPAAATSSYAMPGHHGTMATVAGPASVFPTGQAPTVVSRTVAQYQQPVNLSYVPPPAHVGASVAMAPGQVPRPTYAGAPSSMAVDPSQFNPPRQIPGMCPEGVYDQRPSYTPPPMPVMEQRPSWTPMPCNMPQVIPGVPQGLLASTAKVQPHQIAGQLYAVQQSPSYVPPPVGMPVMQQNPSYVPAPVPGPLDGASVQLPAGLAAQGPSINTLPQQLHQTQHVLQPHMGCAMMGGNGAPLMGMPQMHQGAGIHGIAPLANLAPLTWGRRGICKGRWGSCQGICKGRCQAKCAGRCQG